MKKTYTIVTYLFIILLAEKVVQHVSTVPALVWNIGDVRAQFAVDYTLLIGANIILAAVYLVALYGTITRHAWGPLVVIGPALFDIIAEYAFHGLFITLTVSVIVAVLVLVLALAEYRSFRRTRAV